MSTVEEIQGYGAFWLCGQDLANCLAPDSHTSAGADFLTSVRDAVIEAWEHDPDSIDDRVHEIADAAPDVYTGSRWAEFVDLGAYTEEPETGEWPDDLTNAAGVALYQIAERLARALIEELRDQPDDDDQDDDQDDDDSTTSTCLVCGESWTHPRSQTQTQGSRPCGWSH